MKLQELYIKNNFPSKRPFYKIAKENGLKFTQKEINEFIDSQAVSQLIDVPKKPKKGSKKLPSVVAPGKGHTFQVDLVDYDRYKLNGYSWIMNAVDITSRYAYGVPMTSKSKSASITAIKDIFKHMKIPKTIEVDRGGEFISKEFKDAMKALGVENIYYTEPGDPRKNSIVERFNRTMAMMLQKFRVGTGRKDWYKYLPKIYEIYNNNYHSTIKAKPSDVWLGKDVNRQDVILPDDLGFKIGDTVRIKLDKKTFAKGDEIRYSRDIYTIKNKEKNKWILTRNGKELKRKRGSVELKKVTNVVDSAITTRRRVKEQKQIDQHKINKKVNKEINQLKTVGNSKFLDDVLKVGKKRVRKSKIIKDV